jgi:hypothetical protein
MRYLLWISHEARLALCISARFSFFLLTFRTFAFCLTCNLAIYFIISKFIPIFHGVFCRQFSFVLLANIFLRAIYRGVQTFSCS